MMTKIILIIIMMFVLGHIIKIEDRLGACHQGTGTIQHDHR